jgi:eukaryotic-like serine/threonine-protein kinase
VGLHPGKQITESLRLSRLLGRGAMGSVWAADHLGLQSQVAVKFMAPAVAGDDVSVQRFRLEAKAAAEIRSPHVVQVFDHGLADDGQLFIAMELLEGESLERRVRRAGPLPLHDLAAVVTQASKALAKAHARGIVHRDIKPANVFLLEGEIFVKLLDFGVAKFSGEEATQMTAAGNMVGTPAFMSPEQLFHGRDLDHRGDLWSLAVVAYYALTGVRPFEGTTLGELCVAIKRGTFAPPTTVGSDLPVEIDVWFARALHQDLAARFSSAKEMAQAFELAVGSSSVMSSTPSGIAAPLQTFPGTAVSRPPHRPGKRRAPWLIGVAAATVGLAGAAAMLVSTTSPEVAPAAPAPSAVLAPRAPEEPAGEAQEAAEAEEVAPSSTAISRDESSEGGAPPGSRSRAAGPRPKTTTAPAPNREEDDRSKRAAETLGL